jgi:hypothetical protein
MKRPLVWLGGLYVLFALIGRFVEGMGAVQCECAPDCWCRRPGLRGRTDSDTSASNGTTGNGAAVEGPGEALLMAMAGRPAAPAELFGPGLATLAARIEARPGKSRGTARVHRRQALASPDGDGLLFGGCGAGGGAVPVAG